MPDVTRCYLVPQEMLKRQMAYVIEGRDPSIYLRPHGQPTFGFRIAMTDWGRVSDPDPRSPGQDSPADIPHKFSLTAEQLWEPLKLNAAYIRADGVTLAVGAPSADNDPAMLWVMKPVNARNHELFWLESLANPGRYIAFRRTSDNVDQTEMNLVLQVDRPINWKIEKV